MAVRYEYYNTGDTTFSSFYGMYWYAQTFTTSIAHKITSVKLKLYRFGYPGMVTVSIRATDGSGHPTGPDLCSGTIDGNSLTAATGGTWYEITLGDGYNLAAATKYAIVVRAPGGGITNTLRWRLDTSGAYPGGCSESSSNSGSSWSSNPAYDLMFEEWGEVVGPSIETQDATDIKSTQAALHTKVIDDKGETLSVRHNYGKTTAYGMNTPWQEGKHTDDVISQTVTSLDPETEYHFRGEAIFED